MTTELTTNEARLSVFDLLAQRQDPKKPCLIASLKDKCDPVPYNTFVTFCVGNGIIVDKDQNEIGKSFQAECLSWNYIYLFTNGEAVVATSYDNKVIEATGETVDSFCRSPENANVAFKVYTQFVCLFENKPIVVSVSSKGTLKFRQLLASKMLSGSNSAMLEFVAKNEKGKNKTYSYIEVNIIE